MEHEDLKAMLVEEVRSYLLVRGGQDEEEQLRSVCSALARLLGQLLQKHEKWSRYKWVDAIIPTVETVPSADEVRIQGTMVWGERGQSREWIEPFSAWVQIPTINQEPLRCKILFGDAARGLGTLPYSRNPRHADLNEPARWLFSFSL